LDDDIWAERFALIFRKEASGKPNWTQISWDIVSALVESPDNYGLSLLDQNVKLVSRHVELDFGDVSQRVQFSFLEFAEVAPEDLFGLAWAASLSTTSLPAQDDELPTGRFVGLGGVLHSNLLYG